jgi:hypothetical protein
MRGRLLCTAVLLAGALLSGCGGNGDDVVEAAPRAVPASQSKAARALRLPVMRPAASRAATAGAPGRALQVQVLIADGVPGDSLIRTGSVEPACGEALVDTLVSRNGPAVLGALVWIEGTTAVIAPAGTPERRATVTLAGCQLQPRVQVAPPGSMLQLVMRDPRAESLVIVPSPVSVPIDTISFLTDGQLVPMQARADSIGVLAIFATGLPWARAFVAVTPPGVGAVSDVDGRARFTLDPAGRKAIVRAWHPALGIVSATIDPSTLAADAVITLTFRP